jgi:hypothetical protein
MHPLLHSTSTNLFQTLGVFTVDESLTEHPHLGPLYMEGPNGCWPKSSRFLPIGLLGIVKMGPRALHWCLTQISSHPTWRSTWCKFGTKTLGLSKGHGPRFSLAPITKLGPIWDWALKWVEGLYTERPNCQPICKIGTHLLTQIPCQMGFNPNGLGPKCKVPLNWAFQRAMQRWVPRWAPTPLSSHCSDPTWRRIIEGDFCVTEN